MKNHIISGIDSYYGKSMYIAPGENAGHVLDARDGTDTRMQEIIDKYEASANAIISLEIEAA